MATMKPHVIKPGDYLANLACRFGFDAEQVWADPKNADLAALRDPNVLAPGDILYIPLPEDTRATLPAISCQADNAFAAQVPSVTIQIVFVDEEGKPIADEPFEVAGASVPPKVRQTEGDGTATFEVAVVTQKVTVRLTKLAQSFDVAIGFLDPLDAATDTSGLCGRLGNLAYFNRGGMALDKIDGSLRAAVRAFQEDQTRLGEAELDPSGEVCDDTLQAIIAAHGS